MRVNKRQNLSVILNPIPAVPSPRSTSDPAPLSQSRFATALRQISDVFLTYLSSVLVGVRPIKDVVNAMQVFRQKIVSVAEVRPAAGTGAREASH
jgi:hypothetical protein